MLDTDFMLDQQFTPWLLEANTSPQTSSKAPMLRELAEDALTQLLHLILCKHSRSKCHRCPTNAGRKWELIEHSVKVKESDLRRTWLNKKAAEQVPSVAGLSALCREYLDFQAVE